MPWRATLATIATAVGCYRGAPLVPPPVIYSAWYQEMKDCVGDTTAQFSRIHWFVREERVFRCGKDREAWACFYGPHDIVLTERRAGAPSTVKHEMLHDLGYKHEDEVFARCLG